MKFLSREYNNIHKEQLKVLFHENYYTHKRKRQGALNKYYMKDKNYVLFSA